MPLPMSYYHAKNLLRRRVTHLARKFKRQPRIIATLTSYPARINTAHLAIQSLLAQYYLPDLIILWLCVDEFPNREADLPTELRTQLAHDVQIRWVDRDLKPHKKYFWAMREFPNDIIITFDDDLIYRPDAIAELMASFHRYPHAVSALRTNLITFGPDGTRRPYHEWIYEVGHFHPQLKGACSHRLFATTGAGTLFPPHILPRETFDEQTIRKLCPIADDLWLKVAELYADIPVAAASIQQLLVYIPGTQDVALCLQNIDAGKNDKQLEAVFGYFNTLAGKNLAECLHDGSLDKLMDK